MNKLAKQNGFSAVELILVLAVVGLLGFIGWRVYEQNRSIPEAPAAANTESTEEVPAVESAEDLDKAVDTLNDQDIDSELETSEIDEALAE